jgi:hypothetical protein
VKGIGYASTSWAAVGTGKLVDEVEACLDIFSWDGGLGWNQFACMYETRDMTTMFVLLIG